MDARDVCECGDYRSSHPSGTGPCGVCARGRAPYDHCARFRLSYHSEPLKYLTRDERGETETETEAWAVQALERAMRGEAAG